MTNGMHPSWRGRRRTPVVDGAHEPLDACDAAALASLGRTWDRVDPVPDGLVERATFAVALDEVYAEVAAIQHMPRPALAGVRSAGLAMTAMTFAVHGRTIVVTVDDDGPGTVRLDGWIAPGAVEQVTLRLPEGTRAVRDANGRFAFRGVPHGMAQLIVTVPDDPGTIVTPTLEV